MIKITFDKLNPELITNSIKNPNNGAVITFLGTTRNYTENRKVLHLEYEAYAPMAEKKLNEISSGIAKANGADADVEFHLTNKYPPTINSKNESIFASNVAKEVSRM